MIVWTKFESKLRQSNTPSESSIYWRATKTLVVILWAVPQSSLCLIKADKNGMRPFCFPWLAYRFPFSPGLLPPGFTEKFLTTYSFFAMIGYPAARNGLARWWRPLHVCLQGPFLVFLSLRAFQSGPCLYATQHSEMLPCNFRCEDLWIVEKCL